MRGLGSVAGDDSTVGDAIVARGCAAVHGEIGEFVGLAVLFAEDVLNLEALQEGDAVASLFVKGLQFRAVDAVLAFDLLDHEFRVGDDAQAGMALFDGEVEGGEQGGIFGVVIGALAKEFAELGEDGAVFILNQNPEAGWAGIAA